MSEAVIHDAQIDAGHDGDAVLIVRVSHPNGGLDTVTLDADCARRLLERCGADSTAGLAGKPWRHLLHVLEL
jgi:hypothetical protein